MTVQPIDTQRLGPDVPLRALALGYSLDVAVEGEEVALTMERARIFETYLRGAGEAVITPEFPGGQEGDP